jgi:hypothetical protein
MYRKKPDVDVINDVLLMVMEAFPHSEFVKSLYQQYHERGGLSKKQLQGLYGKASKVKDMPPARLATLEAVILKKTAKYRSEKPRVTAEPPQKNLQAGAAINNILAKYPQHKRVLFFKLKYDNNEPLVATELAELQKFEKLLNK